ncbi:MAG TPA: ribonuclease J [Methylomirabilota bacterium]|nr:ribonuclease J [Methylomirabilota bacterium]
MNDESQLKPQNASLESVSFLALGGEEDVTRNMYLYEYKDQILIVDCGLGFPDETMLGVDLLLPDISYLLDALKSGKKKIVGMLLSHGHEDHIGGLPFILPQLPKFPIYASPLTTALSNEKLAEFNLPRSVTQYNFGDKEIKLGDFTVSFLRVTHSIPDSTNIIIKTSVGNFYHGSDFKFDMTPADGKRTEFDKILNVSTEGVLALMSDSLGSHKSGHTPSEQMLGKNFEDEMRDCRGKFIITTYSSNISRLQQAVTAAEKVGRKVCFVGRSIIKVKEIGQRLGYLQIKGGMEVSIEQVKNMKNNQLVLLVAGSQGQQNSALTRIANGEHKDIRLDAEDVVVFSSDTIPGNEIAVNELLDTIAKKGARVAHSDVTGTFHVSGHGSSGEHMLLIALTKPRFLVPISGTYRDMVAYKDLSEQMGYKRNDIFLLENGHEVIFTANSARFGKKLEIKNVYVDEVSGEELENFVIRDRERLAKEGVIVVLAEVKASDGQLAAKPEIILRGSALSDRDGVSAMLMQEIEKTLSLRKEKITNWVYVRRLITETAGKLLFKKFRTRPLILPVVIEV